MRTLVFALLLGTFAAPALEAQHAAPPAHGGAAIAAEDIRARIGYLASDELAGRDTPSPGLEAAAAYAAAEFARFGLQPAGDSGGFIQRYPLQSTTMDRARVLLMAGATTLSYGTQYFVAPAMSRDSTAAAALYVGAARAGATLPPDVRGKFAVFAIADTLSPATQQRWQESLTAAVLAGMGGGAVGVVVILDPAFSAATIGMLAQFTAAQQAPIPVVGVTHDAMLPLFAAAGQDLGRLRSSELAAPIPLPDTVLIRTASGSTTHQVPNIVAILPGTDSVLKHEYVVFSAHIDHVGVGAADAAGDSIYNGADDDASGTSAVLELAQVFAAQAHAPRRSIVFLLVSGEEKGLLGSRWFVDHPTVPLAAIVADINADMIGRNHPDTIFGIGLDYTSLGGTARAVAQEDASLKLTVAPDPVPQEQLFFRSDHFSFASRDIPALFFTSGLHADYHKPSDEPELIDADKLARVARLLEELGERVANAPEKPEWTEAGRAALAQVQRNQ